MSSHVPRCHIEDMETAPELADTGPASIWEIRIGVHCTEAQARNLVDSIQHLLCPDPEHAPPCPIPWSTAHWPLNEQEAADNYPELVEQARIERRG
jgi:hypothetical protein